jgi:hypothetical protein
MWAVLTQQSSSLALLAAAWLSALLWVTPVWAASAPPDTDQLAQTVPAFVVPLEQPLGFRGQSRFKFLGFEVYEATLWTTPDFTAEAVDQHTVALELQYLRSFHGKDIAKRSIQEMRRIGAFSAAQEKLWMSEMQRVFPPVRAGDRLLGLHRPGESAVFWLNGQALGDIRDPAFARLFFGIWLSPRTSAPGLRKALLGVSH